MTESRTYDLRDFDIVAVATGIRAIVTIGSEYAVRVDANSAEVLDRVDVSAAGGRLHIGIGRGFFDFVFGGGLVEMLKHGGVSVTAYVTLPALNGVEASSGARIEASNVKSDRFHGEASSGARSPCSASPAATSAPRRRAAAASRSMAPSPRSTPTFRAAATFAPSACRRSAAASKRRAAVASRRRSPPACAQPPAPAGTSASAATRPSATSTPRAAATSASDLPDRNADVT